MEERINALQAKFDAIVADWGTVALEAQAVLSTLLVLARENAAKAVVPVVAKVVRVQVRLLDKNHVKCQVAFSSGPRRSFNLVNHDLDDLQDTFSETTKSPLLSLAGPGNHFYTPAFLDGGQVYIQEGESAFLVGTLPEDWLTNQGYRR